MSPEQLRQSLARIGANYRWTWSPSTAALLGSLPSADGSHPLVTIRNLDGDQLTTLAADRRFMDLVDRETANLGLSGAITSPRVAYFSSEFGISDKAPLYAGGLGILAGDHLKSASDADLPLVGVGLFYQRGSFHQEIRDGAQVDSSREVRAEDIGAEDIGVSIEVPFPGRSVTARLLRIRVGSVPLILLDTDTEPNTPEDRVITDRLYQGTQSQRLAQEMVLGVGGVRALAALGWRPETIHLNEGHAGFAAFELIDRVMEGDLESALATVRSRLVFTTHTPVPAGIPRLPRDVVTPFLELWAARWDVPVEALWELGTAPGEGDVFNTAVFCLRMSRSANGVSRLHGEVSRELFSEVAEGAGIAHVTNGVHARTWTSPELQGLFDRALGPGWDRGEPQSWERAADIDDVAIGESRRTPRERLVARLDRNGARVDPDALLVGFARRFAPYKRATLILRDRDRLAALLDDEARPVHFILSGKAHPANDLAMAMLSEVIAFVDSPQSQGRFHFIPDYDIAVGADLVQGCDIWVNNPLRPYEASGTSGQKVVLNGGLNASVLDGWWAEMYDGEAGWVIESSDTDDPDERDWHDAQSLLAALESARTEFFDDRGRFNSRIRHAWQHLGPKVTAARMLRDYAERVYRL